MHSLLEQMSKGPFDDLQTPPAALGPLVPYLPRRGLIWEPACGSGNLVRELSRRGFRVFGSDIMQGERFDFLSWTPRWLDDVSAIVTNPPYSRGMKEKFIKRCYELGKPWALLMPITALGGSKREGLWREFGVQLIMLGGRIDFTGSGNCWYEVMWFTWGLNLPRDIIFGQMPPQEETK